MGESMNIFKKLFHKGKYSNDKITVNNERIPEKLISKTIIDDHPFFNDWVEAFKSLSVREFKMEHQEQLKKLYCKLYPPSILKMRWDGWQIGIPRPLDSLSKEAQDQRIREVDTFLRNFFERVKEGKLYCDYSEVIEKFGSDSEKKRMKGKSGLKLNLEKAYWTFNVKFNKWIDHNIKEYDCSLVCGIDEIVAKSDGILREGFFPTHGPYDIGPQKRKELQEMLLSELAPNLEKELLGNS